MGALIDVADIECSEPSLEQAREYIYSIDFSPIISKLTNHEGWSHQDAQSACKMYRNYLYLKKKHLYHHKLPPSEEIDMFWHMHILDTKKYRYDCQEIFGKYLDHYPYFGIDGATNFSDLERSFIEMQQLYLEEFGEKLCNVRNLFEEFLSLIKRAIFYKKPRRVSVKNSVL